MDNNPITKIEVLFLDGGWLKIKDNISKDITVINKTINSKKADLNKGSGGRR